MLSVLLEWITHLRGINIDCGVPEAAGQVPCELDTTLGSDGSIQPLRTLRQMGIDFVFPKSDHYPARVDDPCGLSYVALNVVLDLLFPPVVVSLR